jgi:hypothetical protein
LKSQRNTAGFCQLRGISSRSRLPVIAITASNSAVSTAALTCRRRSRRVRWISGRAAVVPNSKPVSKIPAQ